MALIIAIYGLIFVLSVLVCYIPWKLAGRVLLSKPTKHPWYSSYYCALLALTLLMIGNVELPGGVFSAVVQLPLLSLAITLITLVVIFLYSQAKNTIELDSDT